MQVTLKVLISIRIIKKYFSVGKSYADSKSFESLNKVKKVALGFTQEVL